MPKKLKAVIFDMDGTLIDSREIVLGAFKHVLHEVGQDFDEDVVSASVGKLLEHTYQSLVPDRGFQELAELHRSWQKDNKHLLKGFDGLNDFLDRLKQKGLKLAIFTSATRPRADLALDGLGVREYFDFIVCGDEVDNPKPHPEGIQTILKELDVAPDEAVMVGDAEHDILSGKSAGVVTIGVTHGFGTKDAMAQAGADYIVDDLNGIMDSLEAIYGRDGQ